MKTAPLMKRDLAGIEVHRSFSDAFRALSQAAHAQHQAFLAATKKIKRKVKPRGK